MTEKRILFLFLAAGLILATVLGIYFYRSNLGPTRDEVDDLLREFTKNIASGNYEDARALMTEESRGLLREPGTLLGEVVYQKLRLKTVENIYSEGNGSYAADVVLSVLDTLKVRTKAGLLFGEQVTESGPVEDPDQALSEIYSEILSRDDLPVIDSFCVIRLEMHNGHLYIKGDTVLQQVLESNSEISGSILEKLNDVEK